MLKLLMLKLELNGKKVVVGDLSCLKLTCQFVSKIKTNKFKI